MEKKIMEFDNRLYSCLQQFFKKLPKEEFALLTFLLRNLFETPSDNNSPQLGISVRLYHNQFPEINIYEFLGLSFSLHEHCYGYKLTEKGGCIDLIDGFTASFDQAYCEFDIPQNAIDMLFVLYALTRTYPKKNVNQSKY